MPGNTSQIFGTIVCEAPRKFAASFNAQCHNITLLKGAFDTLNANRQKAAAMPLDRLLSTLIQDEAARRLQRAPDRSIDGDRSQA